jgi:tetratricopeptide (TPR) repeat protein
MRSKPFVRTLFAALLLAAFAVAASAQTTQVNGTVKLKQADGTEVPVVGAQIDIYRTDIKGEYHTKTDKKGSYIHAGLPFIGTYTIIVSAPGARPSFATKLRFNATQEKNFLLQPGDGAKLTLEEVSKLDTSRGAAPADPYDKNALPASESKEDKAKREEMERKVKEVEEKNKKIEEGNAVINRTFKAGNDALQANRLDEAITYYQEGLASRADEPALLTNLSEALRRRGVNRFNEALKNSDADAKLRGMEEAKKDWKEAADASQKALQTINTGGGDPQQAAIYAQNKIVALSTRALAMRLVATKVDQSQAQAAWDAYQEYIAVETDETKKSKARFDAANVFFDAGVYDRAAAEFQKVVAADPNNADAYFKLGASLLNTGDKAKYQEASNYLAKFAEIAPDTNPLKGDAKSLLQFLKENENIKPMKIETPGRGGRRRG